MRGKIENVRENALLSHLVYTLILDATCTINVLLFILGIHFPLFLSLNEYSVEYYGNTMSGYTLIEDNASAKRLPFWRAFYK